MSAILSAPSLRAPANRSSVPLPVFVVLAAWLAAVAALGAGGAFLGPRGAPPVALLTAFAAPIAFSVLAFRLAPRFRAWVLRIEPRAFAAMQAWRFGGFAFIALWAHGILPGFFAWPAGLGDMAIGASAPLVLARLSESPAFASSNAFVRWNLLGILDLAVAMTLGGLGAFLGAFAPVTTAPMAALPLVLIPAFLVPLFIMMHLATLAKARRGAA
jgi:hypothetical protein